MSVTKIWTYVQLSVGSHSGHVSRTEEGRFMFRQWLALVIIVMAYIPVAIDATVLHVAAPTLSMTLNASGNELLWIIDIYSLVMAGMVLPMGALGDRLGFKRLLIMGSVLFGLSSLAAACATSAGGLIAARASLAVGAAMIIPATLAGVRTLFADARQRNIALGVWAAVGAGGAARWLVGSCWPISTGDRCF